MIETDAGLRPYEVDDLDPDTVLELLDDADLQERAAGRRKLRLAYRWCVLHPAGPGVDRATAGDGLRGLAGECDWHIAGPGTPAVAAFAAETFAAKLKISTPAGQSWLADSLDLVHRLPLIWARVDTLEVLPWKARVVARWTRTLGPVAAGWVDQQLAPVLDKVGYPTIERRVAEAIAAWHPELLDQKAQGGKDTWHVDLHHPSTGDFAGTSFLDAIGDSVDLTDFHDLVCAIAERMRRAGDPDTLDQRKAKALGQIARGEHLTNTPDTPTGTPADAAAAGEAAAPGASPSTKVRRRRPGAPTRLYLHLTLADLLAQHTTGTPGIGTLERLGPATTTQIKTWVGRGPVTIQPILHTDRTDAVDAHDPPAWMAELVRLRDRHCVFPWCACDSRACDLDHIVAYDPHGPPGQTHPDRLAPLCRRHHRAKTFTRWRYTRLPDGTYHWTSPHDDHYLVTKHGTIEL